MAAGKIVSRENVKRAAVAAIRETGGDAVSYFDVTKATLRKTCAWSGARKTPSTPCCFSRCWSW